MNEGVLGGGAPGAAGGDYPRRRRRRISHHLDSYPTPSPRPSPPPPLSLLFLLPLLVSLHSVFSTSLSPPFLFPFCTSPPPPCPLSPASASSFSLLVEGILLSPRSVFCALFAARCFLLCFGGNTFAEEKRSPVAIHCSSFIICLCHFLCMFLNIRCIFAFIYFVTDTSSRKISQEYPP